MMVVQYCLPICTVCEEQSEHHGNCRDHNSANKKEGAAKKCIRNQNIVLSTHKKRTHVCSLLIRSLSRLPSSINSLNGSFVLTKNVFCGKSVCLLWYTCTCIWFYNTKKTQCRFLCYQRHQIKPLCTKRSVHKRSMFVRCARPCIVKLDFSSRHMATKQHVCWWQVTDRCEMRNTFLTAGGWLNAEDHWCKLYSIHTCTKCAVNVHMKTTSVFRPHWN